MLHALQSGGGGAFNINFKVLKGNTGKKRWEFTSGEPWLSTARSDGMFQIV